MWRDRLTTFAAQLQHPAWGQAHSERVFRLALALARGQGKVDRDALCAAAYLHDLGAFAPYRLAGADHAARSVEVMAEVLHTLGFPREKVALVQEIAAGHMYYARPAPLVEAIAFHDADTLDFMGMVGVTKLLAIVGLDDWAPDLPSALRLVQRFAVELPSALYTAEARVLGEERRREMEAFLRALADQTDDLRLL